MLTLTEILNITITVSKSQKKLPRGKVFWGKIKEEG